jgi:hypothetical protein
VRLAGRTDAFAAVAVAAAAALVGALAWAATATPTHLRVVAPAVAIVVAIPIAYRVVRSWELLLAGLVCVILFIPIKRYKLPVTLPFDVEPYRLVVGLLILAWLATIMLDRRIRLRRSPFDFAIACILAAAVGSDVVNHTRASGLSSSVLKSVTFLLSYMLVYVMIGSVVRSKFAVDFLIKVLVGGGALVGASALVERRTHYNFFDHLQQYFPLLRFQGNDVLLRGGRFRALASAQHPIALSAALVMLLPLAYYLVRSGGGKIWWLAGLLLVLGNLSTSSRTGILMLMTALVTFVILRWSDARRMWPALLPMLLLIHLAVPGAIGSIRAGFFPQGGLVAQQIGTHVQQIDQNTRLSRIGPSLDQFKQRPFFGLGYGTRITGSGTQTDNAIVLDDQWLTTLLENGLAGVLAWVVMIFVAIKRFGSAARHDRSPRGALLVALTASISAFAVGMLTFDAFSFIQVTFLFWILLALGAVQLRLRDDRLPADERGGPHRSRPPRVNQPMVAR